MLYCTSAIIHTLSRNKIMINVLRFCIDQKDQQISIHIPWKRHSHVIING